MYPADGETIRDAITAMQTLPIVGISQKEGGTQLKLIIEFEDGGQVGKNLCLEIFKEIDLRPCSSR